MVRRCHIMQKDIYISLFVALYIGHIRRAVDNKHLYNPKHSRVLTVWEALPALSVTAALADVAYTATS